MELRDQLSELSGGSLAATIDAAMMVVLADGSIGDDEVAELADSIHEMSGGIFTTDELGSLMHDSVSRIAEHGPEALLPAIGDTLGGTLSEVALAMAAAAAWSRHGVNASEGNMLQSLRSHLGIDQDRYFELLSLGQQLAQS